MEKVSLIIPLKDEEKSVQGLIDSISLQTVLPDEVIFVDGGSRDRTKAIIQDNLGKLTFNTRLIAVKKAYPGEARNIGIEESRHGLIAFTDGGITLDKKWLEELAQGVKKDVLTDVVYGAYEPVLDSFMKECSLIAYIPPKEKVGEGMAFRTNFIASSIFKKSICRKAGGFPSFRAAEDKVFMDKVRASGARIFYTDKAVAYWQIAGSLKAIFKRFSMYSAHDILAGRARDWHYSIFRTYAMFFVFLLLGISINPVFFWGILLLWIVRLGHIFYKRRDDLKLKFLLNPRYVFGIMLIVLVTDIALFWGSLKYLRVRYEKHA